MSMRINSFKIENNEKSIKLFKNLEIGEEKNINGNGTSYQNEILNEQKVLRKSLR